MPRKVLEEGPWSLSTTPLKVSFLAQKKDNNYNNNNIQKKKKKNRIAKDQFELDSEYYYIIILLLPKNIRTAPILGYYDGQKILILMLGRVDIKNT